MANGFPAVYPPPPPAAPASVSKDEFDSLMRRLDELEAEEDAEDEDLLDSDDDDDDENLVDDENSTRTSEENPPRKSSKVGFEDAVLQQTYNPSDPPVWVGVDRNEAMNLSSPKYSNEHSIPILNDDSSSDTSKTGSILKKKESVQGHEESNKSSMLKNKDTGIIPLRNGGGAEEKESMPGRKIIESEEKESSDGRAIIPMSESVLSGTVVERDFGSAVSTGKDNPVSNSAEKPKKKSLFAQKR